MPDIRKYTQLTLADARRQWRAVLARSAWTKGTRQGVFLPVEALVCFSLFFEVRPNRFGGQNTHRAPPIVGQIAKVLRRSAGSVLMKMANLNLTLANAGHVEKALYARLIDHPDDHWRLYRTVFSAARTEGIGPDVLPDFLHLLEGELDLLGQDELVGLDLAHLLGREAAELQRRLGTSDAATIRIVEHRARVGQHRFARQVLDNYGHRCGFCGFDASRLKRHKLLVASHIKPWAKSNDQERLDVANGVAACPTHDAAFDTGLLTVNGGLRIHRAERLLAAETAMEGYPFDRPVLRPALLVPSESVRPGAVYLRHHHKEVFKGTRLGLK